MIIFIPGFLGFAEWTKDVDFIKGLSMNTNVEVGIGFFKYLFVGVFWKVVGGLIGIALTSAATLFAAGVQWILWKAYLLWLINWVVYILVIGVFAFPIKVIMYCYTHAQGFFAFFSLILLCYCCNQACKSYKLKGEPLLDQETPEDEEKKEDDEDDENKQEE